MKKKYILWIGVLILIALGLWTLNAYLTNSHPGETWTEYRSNSLGIGFKYRLEPDGYLLLEEATSSIPQKDIIANLSLFNKKEYAEVKTSNIPREYPPAISIQVYDNSNNYSPRQWAETESAVSNISISNSQVSNFSIGGVPAVRYSVDGLYPTDVIIALSKGRIYIISGSYLTKDSPIRKDFLNMLPTISF